MSGRRGRLFQYGQLASTSAAGPSAHDLLVVEKGDTLEFDAEGAKYLISRRLSRNDFEALQVIEKKFGEFNTVVEVVVDPNPEIVPLQKRFFVAWSDALAHSHSRIGPCPTPIPLAATSIMSVRLSKWRRLGRWMKRTVCCYKNLYEFNDRKHLDYTKPESRTRFELIIKNETYPQDPKLPPHVVDRQARRSQFFDKFAPDYFHKVQLPKFFRRKHSTV